MKSFLLYLITTFSSIYILSKISEKKFLNTNNFISIIIISIFCLFAEIYGIKKLNITIFYYLCLLIYNKLINNLNINKNFISCVLLFMLNITCETFIIVTFYTLNIKINLIATILTIIFPMILINIVNFKVLVENSKQYISYILFIISIVIYLSIIINIHIKNKILIISSSIFTLIIIILVIKNILEKQKINSLNKRYNDSLSTILKCEEILEIKAKMTHEYKNNLLLIKSMLRKNDKKIHNYIEELLNTNITKLDNKLLEKINYIPFKPFNGLLYYKINEAEKNNINVVLDISSNLKKINENAIDDKDTNDICKLISIFIDNAIDTNKDLEEKEISISMYANNNELIISIANKFNGIVYDKGIHSTKGKYHGYGLKIAKDIIKNNKNLQNTTECISNVFIQNIILSLKV